MTNTELFIRPADTYDAEDIVMMHQELAAYDDYQMSQFNINPDSVRRTITQEAGHERYFIAEDELAPGYLAIAGMMYVSRTSMSWNGSRGVYVEDLYVKEKFRHGRGVGMRLLGEAAALALEYADGDSERAFLRLDTARNNNDDTLRFYDRRGFEDKNTNLRLSGERLIDLSRKSSQD